MNFVFSVEYTPEFRFLYVEAAQKAMDRPHGWIVW